MLQQRIKNFNCNQEYFRELSQKMSEIFILKYLSLVHFGAI